MILDGVGDGEDLLARDAGKEVKERDVSVQERDERRGRGDSVPAERAHPSGRVPRLRHQDVAPGRAGSQSPDLLQEEKEPAAAPEAGEHHDPSLPKFTVVAGPSACLSS